MCQLFNMHCIGYIRIPQSSFVCIFQISPKGQRYNICMLSSNIYAPHNMAWNDKVSSSVRTMSTRCRFRNYFSFTGVSFSNSCCSIYKNETEYIWAWRRVNFQHLQKQILLRTATKSIKSAVHAQRSLYVSNLAGTAVSGGI